MIRFLFALLLMIAGCSEHAQKVEASWIHEELWPVRNFHQAFDHGLAAGMFQAGVGMVTNGRGWGFRNRLETKPGHQRMIPLEARYYERAPHASMVEPAPPSTIGAAVAITASA